MTDITLHRMAQAHAQKAVDEAIEQYGEDNAAFNYCGFAWATIKPARGKFVSSLKAAGVGSQGTYGGWRVSAYDMFTLSPHLSQSMELKEIGTRAYCDYLRGYNIPINMSSRAD